MKKLLPLILGCFLTTATTLRAETLFGPGTITIATNEAILINTIGEGSSASSFYYLDNVMVEYNATGTSLDPRPRLAIAGPHNLTTSNAMLITFQRLNGSAIKTTVFTNSYGYMTNTINVPTGKTIQFFAPMGGLSGAYSQSPSSTNVYQLFLGEGQSTMYPAVTGSATIKVFGYSGLVSYYFTDEVLQLPPQGFLAIPAPLMEVDIQKSYDLNTWSPIAAFNTGVDANAFYRLQIMQ